MAVRPRATNIPPCCQGRRSRRSSAISRPIGPTRCRAPEALCRGRARRAGAHPQASPRGLRPGRGRRDPSPRAGMGAASRRAGRACAGRPRDPAGGAEQCDERADPAQHRVAGRAGRPCLHRRKRGGPQAADAGLRVHVRPAGLRPRGRAARLVELTLRPDDGPRHRYPPQGLGQPRARAGTPLLRPCRDRRDRRAADGSRPPGAARIRHRRLSPANGRPDRRARARSRRGDAGRCASR